MSEDTTPAVETTVAPAVEPAKPAKKKTRAKAAPEAVENDPERGRLVITGGSKFYLRG